MSGFDRFKKRWASNGQIAEITDNNADLGLAFIGDDPPTVELHNHIWQWGDEKDNYLFGQIEAAVLDRLGVPMTEANLNLLRDALKKPASATATGIQRNATPEEVSALASFITTVTPGALKPLIDALQLGVAQSVPAGAVMAFSRATAPAGWLVADGASYNRADYINLFAAIGTTYGNVDSNTFNVPDLRGYFVRGLGPGRTLGSKQANANASHTHGITVAALPNHTHTFSTSVVADHTHTLTLGAAGAHTPTGTIANGGSHTHGLSMGTAGSHSHGAYTDSQGYHAHSGVTYAAGDHQHSINTGSNTNYNPGAIAAGGSGSLQAGLTNVGGAHQHSLAIDGAGTHAHNVGIYADGVHAHTLGMDVGTSVHTHTLTMAAVADHTHTISMGAAGGHSHTGTTDAAGAVTPTATAANQGDTDARPDNIALLMCIKI